MYRLRVENSAFADQTAIRFQQGLGIRVEHVHDELTTWLQVMIDAAQTAKLLRCIVAVHKGVDGDDG